MDKESPNLVDQHVLEQMQKTIELFAQNSTCTTKEAFADDKYAYSLIDNYKSRRTKNVVIHMLKNDINILYYNEEYKNIIFINFLRLCQLNNLNVKKYHDMFLKYDIFSYILNSEKYVHIFLKPIINNDKLLWDVNTDHFEFVAFPMGGSAQNENGQTEKLGDDYEDSSYVLEERQKLKLDDLVVNSSDCCESSAFSEDEISVSSGFSEKSPHVISGGQKMNGYLPHPCGGTNLEECPKKENAPVVKKEQTFQKQQICKEEASVEGINDNTITLQEEEKSRNGLAANSSSTLNNINLNHLIDTIVEGGKWGDEESPEGGVYKRSNNGMQKSSLNESIIEKFVTKSENDQDEVLNLYKKVNSMEKIIKHLIGEIVKRDMVRKAPLVVPRGGDPLGIVPIEETEKTEQNDSQKDDQGNPPPNDITSSTSKNSGECEEDTDSKYFESYNNTCIHRTMILDKSRTNCYYEFVKKNKEIFENKVVLDIGCGSSIISLFCADHAKVVVGIDNAHRILTKAKKITEKNGANNIYLFEGKLEENNIYVDEKEEIHYINKKEDLEKYKNIYKIKKLEILKFDIIISEWMGYFLFYECMIDTILYARDFYLKENGLLLPNKVYLYLAGYNDSEYINENILIWDNPLYGKDLSELKPSSKNFLENAKIIYLDKNKVSTEVVNYAIIDMYTYRKNENVYISSDFKIAVNKGKVVTSLCFYFDCHFEAYRSSPGESTNSSQNVPPTGETCTNTILTTSMFKEETHWRQTLLHLHCLNFTIASISAPEEGEHPNELSGRIFISPAGEHSRNVNALLQIKKNESMNVSEDWTCWYSLD
ncbi:Histone-arginine methyltransferase [Plasmodium coatneyi]|uniref:Histone-arginine methyltransferase n=1 Tax=Plasmodium coatneyi TaxID=208452 RepID=A0A1B1E362_9APIC|nr:Histone-arginine methyltransferase [Plasmodium coatneyi]ANQ09438.1 Histone-arginine methyltransferase [Plasmodium coatneyi]